MCWLEVLLLRVCAYLWGAPLVLIHRFLQVEVPALLVLLQNMFLVGHCPFQMLGACSL